MHSEPYPTPHQYDNKARVYEDSAGRLWVTHEELLECGYRNISDFDIVYLNGKFYELQAFVRRPFSWWIEEVSVGEETQASKEAPGPTEEGETPLRSDP